MKARSPMLLLAVMTLAVANAWSGTVTYVYTNSQGSPLVEADANGNVVATYDYSPYGSQAMAQSPHGPGFTGHVSDLDTGFIYMQARYYDPAIGRFLGTDPIRGGPGNVFSSNRFSYANANPARFIDLDGREVSVSGAADDVKTFLAQTYQMTGLKVQVKNGKLEKMGERDTKVGSAVAARELSNAISMKQTMSVVVRSNDRTTLVDRNDTKVVDVADLGALFKRNAELGAAVFTHFISERAMMAKGVTFDVAHERAIGIEANAFGHGATSREEFDQPYPGGQFQIDYLDSQGRDIASFKFTLDENVTPKP